MSFSSFNGNVDVAFPADLGARVRIKAGQGEILSDFELALEAQAPILTRDENSDGTRFELESEVRGTIGAGGPELRFETYNGNVLIRKRGAERHPGAKALTRRDIVRQAQDGWHLLLGARTHTTSRRRRVPSDLSELQDDRDRGALGHSQFHFLDHSPLLTRPSKECGHEPPVQESLGLAPTSYCAVVDNSDRSRL